MRTDVRRDLHRLVIGLRMMEVTFGIFGAVMAVIGSLDHNTLTVVGGVIFMVSTVNLHFATHHVRQFLFDSMYARRGPYR